MGRDGEFGLAATPELVTEDFWNGLRKLQTAIASGRRCMAGCSPGSSDNSASLLHQQSK